MKRALIVVDYVYDFVSDDGKLTCGKVAQNIDLAIVNLIHEFERSGDLVVEATDCHDFSDIYNAERLMFPLHCYDEKGRELYGKTKLAIKELPRNQYLKIDKNRYSAFFATPLNLKLKERFIKEIHIVGVCTDICVLHTAIEAYNLGYKVIVHKDGVASFNQSGHAYTFDHIINVLGGEVR
ncbi:MAG: isochorismatase family cysteine hydrolase [Eubacteriales bacterium]